MATRATAIIGTDEVVVKKEKTISGLSIKTFLILAAVICAFSGMFAFVSFTNIRMSTTSGVRLIDLSQGRTFYNGGGHISYLYTESSQPYTITVPYESPNTLMKGDSTHDTPIEKFKSYWHKIDLPNEGSYIVTVASAPVTFYVQGNGAYSVGVDPTILDGTMAILPSIGVGFGLIAGLGFLGGIFHWKPRQKKAKVIKK